MGNDKRRSKRTKLNSTLILKRLDAPHKSEEIDIEVIDVSKSGVGFSCDKALEIGAVYETYLTIWTSEVLHAFLQIIRIVMEDGQYIYGSVFIGMPEMEANRISVYQTFSDE